MNLNKKLELWRQLNAVKLEPRPAAVNFRPEMYFDQLSQQYGYADNTANDPYSTVESWESLADWDLSSNARLFYLYNQAQKQQQMLINHYHFVMQQQYQLNQSMAIQRQQNYHQSFNIPVPDTFPRYRQLSPQPIEPIAPPPESDEYVFKGQTFSTFKEHTNYRRRYQVELRKIRHEPASDSFDFFSDSEPYCIFRKPGVFRFAIIRKKPASQFHPPHLNDYEYAEMRKDFAMNGYEEEFCDRESFDVGNKNEFPPLDAMPEQKQTILSQVFTSPLQPVNVNQPKVVDTKVQENRSNKNLKDRRGKQKKVHEHCVFCLNNKETFEVYSGHVLKDEDGKVLCPKLFSYKCPICGASGENAHTLHHCPHRPVVTPDDIARSSRNRNSSGSSRKRQSCARNRFRH